MKFIAFNGSPAGADSATGRILTAPLEGRNRPGRRRIFTTWETMKSGSVRGALPAGFSRRGSVSTEMRWSSSSGPISRRM
jgi:hypothetical protein